LQEEDLGLLTSPPHQPSKRLYEVKNSLMTLALSVSEGERQGQGMKGKKEEKASYLRAWARIFLLAAGDEETLWNDER
jgi:hypothetical protein